VSGKVRTSRERVYIETIACECLPHNALALVQFWIALARSRRQLEKRERVEHIRDDVAILLQESI
jgi:hypothetical protein